jgi:hypothetical protein
LDGRKKNGRFEESGEIRLITDRRGVTAEALALAPRGPAAIVLLRMLSVVVMAQDSTLLVCPELVWTFLVLVRTFLALVSLVICLAVSVAVISPAVLDRAHGSGLPAGYAGLGERP